MRGNAVVDRGLTGVVARHDLGRREETVPVGVVPMVVRVDDAAERFPGGGFGGGLEGLGVDRRAQRVDGQETGGPGNHAGVAQARVVHVRAAGLRVRVDVGCEPAQFGGPGWDHGDCRRRSASLADTGQSRLRQQPRGEPGQAGEPRDVAPRCTCRSTRSPARILASGKKCVVVPRLGRRPLSDISSERAR